MKRRKENQKRYRPYQKVKIELYKLEDPFGDAPVSVRQSIMREIGAKSRATFEAEFPRLKGWFQTYDPLYVLSFCAFNFLTSEKGIDREAIDGKLDFSSHHLELLQAVALTSARAGTPKPLGRDAELLKTSLTKLSAALQRSDFDFPADLSEGEMRKRMLLAKMKLQTLAIRNWAYPEQTVARLKSILKGALSDMIAARFGGISIMRVIDALAALIDEINGRINGHTAKLRPVMRAKTFEGVYREYRTAFPEVINDKEGMRGVFDELCRRDVRSFQAMLMMHADLRLAQLFTFSVDDLARAYGDTSHRVGLVSLLAEWSHSFGDLSAVDPKRFLYTNPVLQRPFVGLGGDVFFWALCGVYFHSLPAMVEALIPPDGTKQYMAIRSKYLEDQVEALCRSAFPDGRVYRGCQYKSSPSDPASYENDILVTIDSTAIVIECKAHLIDPSARRGGELRFINTMRDIVVSASAQAQRFVDFLRANPKRHEFATRSGGVNEVDASAVMRFIPLSVTYENLGLLSADLEEAVEAGLIPSGQPIVPSICLTDFETILETLESQAQRIHYLSRRLDLEGSMHYGGDELDLFAFYLDTGFNIGSWEGGEHFVDLTLKSKELDPYFVGRADGIVVPKPNLKLTKWWRDILARIEMTKAGLWTELAYIFLNFGYEEQKSFEIRFRRGKTGAAGRFLMMVSENTPPNRFAIVGFQFNSDSREERNRLMNEIAAEVASSTQANGFAVLGVSTKARFYPYDVLAFLPGRD